MKTYTVLLYVAALAVMIGSSWIDGAYLSRLTALAGAGYALNVVCDLGNLLLSRIYAELRLHSNAAGKRYRHARILLWFDGAAVFYSWLFSYRQLRPIVFALETMPVVSRVIPGAGPVLVAVATELYVAVVAAFAPALLAGFGFAQALLSEREEASASKSERKPAHEPALPVELARIAAPVVLAPESPSAHASGNGDGKRAHTCARCGREFGTPQALSAHKRFCVVEKQGEDA